MYLSPRAIRVRNLSVASVNGIITLIILIIAPLGLFAVIINTALVTASTYFVLVISDRVIRYLTDSKSSNARLEQNPEDFNRVNPRNPLNRLDQDD